jgi:DNA-binding CsgD family transcriptional regulator/PAS domain-containing protein
MSMSSHDSMSAPHRTTTVESFTSLIADVYDAALDPALWTDVLPRIGDFVGGHGGGIVSKDTVSKAGTPNYHFGVDPHYVQIYMQTHYKFDSLSTLPLFDRGQIVSAPDLVPYDEFRQGRFFHEWMSPQDWTDAATAVLDKSALSFSFLMIFRTQASGMVDEDMRQRMALVVPHVRRAVLIGRAMDHKTALASAFAETLDGISAGMFLVDGKGRIVHANASGQALLEQRSVLRAGDGKVGAVAADADQELKQSLASASGGDAAVGVKGIAVPLTARDGGRHVAHVLPLTSGERRQTAAGCAAVAALFVHKAELATPSRPETIARLYKLTPTELRVLLTVAKVGGVPEIAEELGIGEATVKTHLHRLFAKTGTTRQAELIKLVAGFSAPLVN